MSKTLNEDDVLKEIDRWIGYLDEDMITRIKIRIKKLPSAQPSLVKESGDLVKGLVKDDTISRKAAIDVADAVWSVTGDKNVAKVWDQIKDLPSAQPEIIRCKDCKWGAQDEVGRWFCRSLGCQIGNEDGSGFCADAERRTDE